MDPLMSSCCSMSSQSPDVAKLKSRLDPGHVLHTMISEHDMILKFLDDLEKTNQTIQTMTRFETKRPEFELLKSIASHLIGAEAHHKREEDVLFPELEKRGFAGPPHVMRSEHQDLRQRKHQLQDLTGTISERNFSTFKNNLDPVSQGLVTLLRDHIFKENNILYPMSLQVIPESAEWVRMKEACDRIGYCCFTPKI